MSTGGPGTPGGIPRGSGSGAVAGRKSSKKSSAASAGSQRKSSKGVLGASANERTVRRLRLSKALTLPAESTTVADACRRMVNRRVDACLLTDSNALLCGIVTDKDMALRCVGEGLDVNTTQASQVMTRNPVFVNIDSSAVDALLKMVQGRFRHLPVVDNGEVVALLDITRCLYDAIARMERAAEKGHAIAAAIEGVERQWGDNSALAAAGFVETFREKIFRPTIATIIGDQTRVALVNKSDAVRTAARRMKEMRVSSVIVTSGANNKPCGILTSKDILRRVLALSLKPEETIVEKVMTPNPECAALNTTIVDALHMMHDGKYLHLPVVDKDGNSVACIDVLQLTHGAMSSAAGAGGDGSDANQLMQRFWDSALALDPVDTDEDAVSVRSAEFSDQYPSLGTAAAAAAASAAAAAAAAGGGSHNSSRRTSLSVADDAGAVFMFKMEDRRGRVHRFTCGTDSVTELVCAIASRLGGDYDPDNPPTILYDDEDGDKVVISVDEDLTSAVRLARACGLKGLKISLDYHDDDDEGMSGGHRRASGGRAEGTRRPRGPHIATNAHSTSQPSRLGPSRPSPARRKYKRVEEEDEEDERRKPQAYESGYWMYTVSLVGVSMVAAASIGFAVYLHRNKS